MGDKTKEQRLAEAKEAVRMREEGKTLREIGDELGIAKSTVHNRIEMWKEEAGGREVSAEDEKAKDAMMILQTVKGVLSERKIAEDIGKITGANVSTIEGVLKRIREGKATRKEIFNILSDFAGSIYGYIEGTDIFKQLDLPERERAVDKEKLKEEVKEELLAEIGGGSSKKKKKKENEED